MKCFGRAAAVTILASGVLAGGLVAQSAVPRILVQDTTLDNLATPPGYATGPSGKLGSVRVEGTGARPMILIPGLGFGGDVFESLVNEWRDTFTMYLVTLPGFGGTPAPPTPPRGTSFGSQTWTASALTALKELIRDNGLDDVVVVGHWLTGTQIALRLAIDEPTKVSDVVLLSGSARWTFGPASSGVPAPTLRQRAAAVDTSLAPSWFRTVTRETWDDNNFLPGDYAVQPVLGLRLWREAARPGLHVWVRYLCEFIAQDITLDLSRLHAPTLLLQPDLAGAYHDPGNDYLDTFINGSWGDLAAATSAIRREVVPGTRIVSWADRPEAVRNAIEAFLKAPGGGRPG